MDAGTANQGRIAAEFERLREQGKKALVTFITAGDPGVDYTVPAMHSLVAGGANLLELGIPFSDPEAEGPTIQAANERALANGMTLNKVLDMVVEFRTSNSTTPTPAAPIFHTDDAHRFRVRKSTATIAMQTAVIAKK